MYANHTGKPKPPAPDRAPSSSRRRHVVVACIVGAATVVAVAVVLAYRASSSGSGDGDGGIRISGVVREATTPRTSDTSMVDV